MMHEDVKWFLLLLAVGAAELVLTIFLSKRLLALMEKREAVRREKRRAKRALLRAAQRKPRKTRWYPNGRKEVIS